MARTPKLLLVEDERLLRELVAQFLRTAGFQVVEAADGPDGVERYLDDGPFELALIDLNLPGFSGVEVCRQIRQERPNQKILICSATVTAEYERMLREQGVTHFLTKPYHPQALLAHIDRVLQGRPGVSAA
jgi:DNA-binding response OmpR family regulator